MKTIPITQGHEAIVDDEDYEELSQHKWHFRPGSRPKSTGYAEGVSWNKHKKQWVSRVIRDGKAYQLGYFEDEISAARAYDAKAKELFGEYSCTNEMLGLVSVLSEECSRCGTDRPHQFPTSCEYEA